MGQAVAGDDVDINVLPLREVAALYHLLDLCLITSRHEGGPRAILEAAASRIPLVSTPVGLAQDIVHSSCLYDSVDEGIEKVEQIARRVILGVPQATPRVPLSAPTVRGAFATLQDLGIVVEVTGQQRHRVYAYQAYLDILSEGAQPL